MKKEKIIEKKARFFSTLAASSLQTTRGKVVKFFSSFITCYLLFVICSCEQPFKAGLGPVIDLQDPTIVLDSPIAGAYIRKEKEFKGSAADDYKLDSVWFHLSNYPDIELDGFKKTLVDGDLYHRIENIEDTKGVSRNWKWSFKINTLLLDAIGARVFPDGDFKLRLRVVDSMGKYAITDEIVFYVKNDIPDIAITAPPIQQGEDDGFLGGPRLNYGYISDQTSSFKRVMDTKSDIFGRISDFEGIYRGEWDPVCQVFDDEGNPVFDSQGNPETMELFPPQIRFWQVYFDDAAYPVDKNGNRVPKAYKADYIPTLSEEPWQTLKRDVGDITEVGGNNLNFEYKLSDDSGSYYAFQIRAQSIDSIHSSAEYPRDYINFENATPEFIKENSYVLILVREPLEYPAIGLYKLEDIYGNGWRRDGELMTYQRLPAPEITDQIEKDGNHVYVDTPIVRKKGAFTLRVKTSHGGGIASAKVYWEKSDKSEKGRFIWDPVERPPTIPEWRGSIPSKSAHYSTWGLNEPDGVTRVRSFVFTYSDENPDKTAANATHDKLPDNDAQLARNAMGNIQGKSKIQRYKSDAPSGKDGKTFDYDELPDALENWDDVYKLDEGTYNLYIYATSMSGTRVPTPFNVTIYIDRGPPTIKLISIEGSAKEERVVKNGKTEVQNTVNGVIQPLFLFSDSRPADTDIRTASLKYFAIDDNSFYPERAYILVPEASITTMDAYLAANPWPPFTDVKGQAPLIPGVTISKHGPIIDSSARFRTSKIYQKEPLPASNPENTPGEVLADGNYRLYVFARDKAFNAGRESFPIKVLASSDIPVFDFSIGSVETGITEPDSAYDVGGSKYDDAKPYEKSFIVANGNTTRTRGLFSTNSSIQVRITDDDSLDMGVQENVAEKSGIVVSFVGSKVEKNTEGKYEVVARTDPGDLMTLKDNEIEAAFDILQTMEDGKRTKVKESKSDITHKMLLDLLKKTPAYDGLFTGVDKAAVNTIPDGIYRVGISICDYSPAKLIMGPPFAAADPRPADVVTVTKMPVPDPIPAPNPSLPADDLRKHTEYFWIAVDTHNPEIKIENEAELSGGIILPGTPLDLKGTVSDENGPITLFDWRVRNGNTVESKMSDATVPADKPKIVAAQPTFKTYSGGKWIYEFSYKLDMNGRQTGTYDFEVTFQDRFGNKSTKILRNSVDNGQPRVTLIKKIETFSRPFDDVDLKPGTYPQHTNTPQINYTDLNKTRLAVKVVNFTINATDDNGVAGVRWWLLPVDTGANSTGLVTTGDGVGKVSGYDAFPSKQSNWDIPGVYYGNANNTGGLTKGVYGVVDVKERKFTIAFDSRKLAQPDGEYRLHIIAIDNAGNYSDPNVGSDTSINVGYVFQELFFLQEEDKPYLDKGISPGYIDPAKADAGLGWPKVKGTNNDVEMDVLGGTPIIRGTVWENNGFFGDGSQNDFWPKSGANPGSVTVWFSGTAADLPGNWETLVKDGSDITNYVKKNIPNDILAGNTVGLGMQGRNVSLSIALQTLFPAQFTTDGRKRYIIKATDSPVNKLKENTYPVPYNILEGNGERMGVGTTSAEDEGIRVSRWRQYAFVYDAVPPKVVIDTPVKKPIQTYGRTFASTFILGGYISDANLEKTASGDYYFDYYLNSEPKTQFPLKAMTGVNLNTPILVDVNGVPLGGQPSIPAAPADSAITAGRHIYAITKDPAGKITVYFRIKTSDLSKEGGIIPESKFNTLAEGQHTLTLWAADKGGKEGVDWVDFIKDIEPPKITFTNLTGNNRPYDATNESKVDKENSANPAVTAWWSKDDAAKKTLLLGNNAANPLPLTTIYYDNGIPELRGTITDLVSPIDIETETNPAVVATGEVNKSTSAFLYWIDNEYPAGAGRYLAIIDGAGTKSVRWTILLTNDGTKNGTPLYDGVHTIVLKAKDTAGVEIDDNNRYMIAFRIDSKPPRSVASVTGASSSIVYGNVAYQNPTSTSMFTLNITGDDANLDKVEMRIVNTTLNKEEPKQIFNAQNSNTWTYYSKPKDNNGAAIDSAPLTPPDRPLKEDYVLFKGTYGVPKSLFTDSGKYDVIVAAYDTAGNKSEEFTFSFTYDKDSPVIEFTNPADENKNATGTNNTLTPADFIDLTIADLPGKNKINRLTSENLRIQGNVKDDFSAISQVQSRVERWNWLTGAWVQVEDWKNIQDYSANTQLQVAWTKNLLGQNNVQGQPAVDLDLRTVDPANTTGEGLYRIQVRAKDKSIINIPPGTNDWNTTTGQGNPVVSQYEYFYFDRTNPTLLIDSINGAQAMDTYYSNPGNFTFKGRVTDNNRFAKVEVKFESGTNTTTRDATLAALVAGDTGFTTAADNPARTINMGGKTQKWEAVFAGAGNFPDGKYKVTVTVYDMTGRYSAETKSFILDSTPPTVRFTLPAKVQGKGYGDDKENVKPTPQTAANGFASEIVEGGPTAVITGETGDRPGLNGEDGSQSGVDQMWFHLGYIDNATNSTNTNYPFPTKDAIKAWESTLIQRHSGLAATAVTALSVKDRNTWMNTIAEYRALNNDDNKGNAWFKLGGSLKPTGFVINNPNIYDWRFEIPDKTTAALANSDPNYADYNATIVDGIRLSAANAPIEGLKLYCGTITLKGRTYTVGDTAARQMVRAVAGQAGGVYRLPLWIRLTDIAGNVEYYCHDIWIDSNGSIPSTSIESPDNGTQYNARGGTISVDGVARSNTSVYGVIFRVFADGVPDTNLDGIQTNGRPTNTNHTIGTNGMPVAANLVKINGYTAAEAAMVNKLPTAYQNTAWQNASLTLNGGSGEPVIPWSIMLNSEDQIRNLISTKGFASGGSGNDMIRVWLEVFVFNGTAPTPIRSSIYPNDNKGTANYQWAYNGGRLYGSANTDPASFTNDNPGPKPYVRAFYIRTGAAAITHPNVGNWVGGNNANPHLNFTWNAEDPQNQGGGGYKGAGTETRKDRFAFSATLDPNPSNTSGSGLGEVAYRIKLDGGNYSAWTTVWKAGDAMPNTATQGVRLSVRDTTGNRIRYYFDYAIASKATANVTEAGTTLIPVPGANWVNTGGTITLQVRMKDNSPQPNEAEQTIQVGVDNFTPLADTNYRTNPKVAGTNVNFIGRVYDYAKPASPLPAGGQSDSMNTEYTPRKLERVSVWFTKGNNTTTPYINMNTGATTATLTGTRSIAATAANARTSAITGGGAADNVDNITILNRGTAANITYPGLGTLQAHNADYVRDISQATAGDPRNKMQWSPVASANHDVRWSFTLDSTLLPDGDLTLHYIVVDEAGNASYYTQTGISVRNHYPEITKVTLYTDNNGQGAQFTMDDTIEYDLNNYRAKMFANYTDTADNTPNASNNNIRKSDTTGYLNSGFISKNRYIGFKVETTGGNRPLNFRLQHVKRTRIPLTAANLTQMVTDRAAVSATTINLYTIAWHGDYTPQRWKTLGVPINNPTLGTHFVFNPTEEFTPANYASQTAEVWRYTAVVTRADIANPTVAGQNQNADPFVYGPTDAFNFNGATHFGTTGNNVINEYRGSHPDAGAGDVNQDNPGTTAFFMIRVWDSINTNGTGETRVNDQLYDALVVGMNVFLTDSVKPVARLYDLNPYTEAAVIEGNTNQTIRNAANPTAIGGNIVRGGLYNAGTARAMVRSGFIDPRNGTTALNPVNGVFDANNQPINRITLPDYPLKVDGDAASGNARDQVSGKIILRGHAWDDQLINTISLTLPSGTVRILELTNGKMAAPTAVQNSAFVVEELHWKTGHSVEWAYIWDTGTAPASNAAISVSVTDRNGPNTSNAVANDTATAYHNSANVDIVPYITGFERATPAFTTKRSLQGWYSFYQGEQGVKVNGYNFGTGAGAVSLPGAANIATTNGTSQFTQRVFNVPTGATSGAITVTFGGTAAYNNTSTTAGKSWNKEYNSYTPGSNLWINKHYAHIWRSAHEVGTGNPGATGGTAGTIFAADGTSSGLDSPGMSLQYTGNGAGRLHGSWTVYGRESLFYAQNTGIKPTVTPNATTTNSTAGEGAFGRDGALLLIKAGEPYSDGDIDYYNGAGGDNYTNNTSVVAAFQRDGEPWLVLKPRLSSIVFNNAGSTDGGGHDYGYYISRQNGPVSTYRWKNTRIKKADVSTGDANPGKVFVSAYDSTYKRLFFKTVSGTLAANNSGNQITNDDNGGTALYLDGGTTGNGPTTGIGGTAAVTLGQGAGNWSAVDYTSQGYPVVAYFDEQNQTLRLAYANSATPTNGNNWTRRYVLANTDALYRGSGSYVSMEIDRANGNRIHLAFYNSTYKAVVYATSTTLAGTFTASVVDRVVEGGQWTDISVDSSGNPWIVYADSARTGTRDGARIAYRSYSGTGTVPTGAFGRTLSDSVSGNDITGWEAVTMPANYQVNNDRLNIAVWPPTGVGTGAAATSPIGGWNAAVGYASDQFRIGYFFKPTTTMQY